MKTFVYIEKNGSGILTFNASDEDSAEIYLAAIVTEPNAWRLEEGDDDDFEDINDEEE